MIINIIAILLLAGGVLSSLPVHGSISMIDDDAVSINLHANKAGVGDDLDELIEKLKIANAKQRIYLDLGEKIIEIINRTDHEQDCFEVDDISEILRLVVLLIQERGKRIINQDSIHHEDLHFVVPRRYQNSMNLDQELEYYVPSQILSNVELTLERQRLNSRTKLFFKYIKSIQDSLSRLIRLLDVKWRQLHDDSFRWRLLNLQKQAQFLLEKKNQQQHAEKSKNSEDNFSRDKSRNGISNDEEIKIKKTTMLNAKEINNFHKPDKTEMDKNKTQRTDKNITINKLASTVETRIMSHSRLLNNISSHNFKNKNSTAINLNNLSSQNFIKNRSTEVKSDLNNQEISKTNKFTRIFHDKSFTGFADHGNRSSEARKIYAILSGKNITSTIKKIEKEKQDKTRVIFHKFSKTNVIDKPRTPSRRMLQILVSSDESKGKKQKIHHASRKKIERNSRENVKARINDISAIDEILEAVDEVLPSENPMEILSRGLKKTIPRMS